MNEYTAAFIIGQLLFDFLIVFFFVKYGLAQKRASDRIDLFNRRVDTVNTRMDKNTDTGGRYPE